MRDRSEQYDRAVAKAKELFIRKNREYGDSIATGGVEGAVFELIGVVSRLRQVLLTPEGRNLPEAKRREILFDKFQDGLNYCSIGLMLLEDDNIVGLPFPEEMEVLGNDCT